MSSTKKQAITGTFWNGLQLVINTSFTFGIRLVLAKLLMPEQFGLIGMATVFTGFVQVLNDIGIGAALVQRKDAALNAKHFQTAFWTGVIWSVCLYLILSFGLAPIAAHFYDQPLLTKLIPVLSLGILSSPVNLVHKAQLTRQMDFKKMAIIDNISNITAGCVALALAYSGAEIWSLAFNSVASIVIAMPLYFKATGWLPKLVWSEKEFKDIFGFGLYTTGTSIVNYFMNNVDYLLIGKLVSSQALGTYTFAFIITDAFKSRLVSVINNVMYPLYGKKQSDPDSLKRYYLKVIEYNSIAVYPIMLLIFTLGEPFILQLFGAKWHGAILPVQFLSISVMIQMTVNSNTALIRGMGRPDIELKLQIVKSFIYIPVLAIGIYNFGVKGAAVGVLINRVVAVIVTQYTFKNLLPLQINYGDFFKAIRIPWLASFITYVFVVVLYKVLDVNYIFSAVGLFACYAAVIYLFKINEFRKTFSFFKLKGATE